MLAEFFESLRAATRYALLVSVTQPRFPVCVVACGVCRRAPATVAVGRVMPTSMMQTLVPGIRNVVNKCVVQGGLLLFIAAVLCVASILVCCV